ncbi:MAG TPA: DUF962 domain-containing protein [Gammaproteobacteria bacterium]|nr:DUF962 domain-containing protein [Gammaproteobacteria bacterium]
MQTAGRFESFESFWPFYLAEHRKPLTRWLHFTGTASLLPLFILALIDSFWWLLLYPVCAYGLAWSGHFFIERNRPATFSYPLWSLFGDFKMFWYMLIGSMNEELQRNGIGNT